MSSKAHILIVEDQAACQQLLRCGLEQAGYDVQVAATGQVALELCAQDLLDLVLLDISLPDRDGLAVCAALRQHSTVPILMLSAVTCTEKLLEALTLGADGYLTKPFYWWELVARIQALLRRCARRQSDRPTCYLLAAPGLCLNATCREVWVRGALVALTSTEFRYCTR